MARPCARPVSSCLRSTQRTSIGLIIGLMLALACSQPTTGPTADIPIVKPDYRTNNNPNNQPPELKKVGDRSVVLGQLTSITLEAFDPDQDVLVFSVFGSLPSGAKFDKTLGRFDWTPDAAGAPIYLTFQVSDGQDVDRETVKFTVGSLSDPIAPKFEKISDQVVQGGTFYSLKLTATDANGDSLLYGVEGTLPKDAALDPVTGQFSWNIANEAIGTTQRIHFTVTDGALMDEMPINFVVTAGANGPSPPIFTPQDDINAQVGEQIGFQLNAVDPNQDIVFYGFDGAGPPGSDINPDTGWFSWTPQASDSGKTFSVTFFASDGSLKSYLEMSISVGQPTGTNVCQNDLYEDNDLLEQAASIAPGYYNDLSICDGPDGSDDEDWFLVQIPTGKTLSAILTWDPNGQPLNLFIVSLSGGGQPEFVSTGQGQAGQLLASYKNTSGSFLYVQVAGADIDAYSQTYNLTLEELNNSNNCIDDLFDANNSNNSPETATPVDTSSGSVQLQGLSICGEDEDWFRFDWNCGESAQVRILFNSAASDLDLFLYDSSSTTNPLTSSAGLVSPETVTVTGIATSGTYLAKVKSYPPSASGEYTLEAEVEGNQCIDDDAEPNNSTGQAKYLPEPVNLPQQKLCCDDDYYGISVAEGETLNVLVSFQGGAGTVEFYPSLTMPPFEVWASPVVTQSGNVVNLSWQATFSYLVFVRVSSSEAAGLSYSLTTSVDQSNGPECDDLSCQLFDVCDPDAGCVPDFCQGHEDCPVNHQCFDTYCVNPCSDDGDCRVGLEYRCKDFGQGLYCGHSGSQDVGESCADFSDCSDEMVCMYLAYGGYCSISGCMNSGDCPTGSSCLWEGEFSSMCVKNCLLDTDCRQAEGYSCQDQGSFKACLH